jgi:hypothetical protein
MAKLFIVAAGTFSDSSKGKKEDGGKDEGGSSKDSDNADDKDSGLNTKDLGSYVIAGI